MIRNEDDVIWDVFTAFVVDARDITIPGNLYGPTLDTSNALYMYYCKESCEINLLSPNLSNY